MSEAWTRKEGQNPSGGLNEKGRKSYEAANPGSDLKAPQPKGGPRKKSFCARMGGMKKKLTSSKTANDPDSRINKSLRKWNCKDGGSIEDLTKMVEELKDASKMHLGQSKRVSKHIKKMGVGMKNKKQKGGYLSGPKHKDGGMPAIIAGKEPVELEGGEYIVKASTVDAVGKENMDTFNKTGRLPQMKKGGEIKKRLKKKKMGGSIKPYESAPIKRFPKDVKMMGHGGQVSISNNKAGCGDIAATYTHSGYKAGE
jgi:hypothetical protein